MTDTNREEQPTNYRAALRDAGLEQMIAEAHAKGTTVSRADLETVIARDPNGAAAQRLQGYEKLGNAALLAAGALRSQGIDPQSLSSEALLHSAQAVQGVLDRAQSAPAPTVTLKMARPAPSTDRGMDI